MQAQMRELTAALESWQPGSYAAVIEGGASALWSGCAAQQAAAVVALAVLAASPIGCAAAAYSPTLPMCLEMLSDCDACAAGTSPGAARPLPAVLSLAILRTLSRVVVGSRDAAVPLALVGGIPLLHGIATRQREARSVTEFDSERLLFEMSTNPERSLVGLESERLLFEMSTHPELTWPCFKHRVLTAAVGALVRAPPALSLPAPRHATACHSADTKGRCSEADSVGGEGARQASASRRALLSDPPRSVPNPSLAPILGHRAAQAAHAAPLKLKLTGAHAEFTAFCGWDEHRLTEAAVRRAAAAAARMLVSPPQALLPLLAHNEVYAALALLAAAAHAAGSTPGASPAADTQEKSRSSPCHARARRSAGPAGVPCGGCTLEDGWDGLGHSPYDEACAAASRTVADVATHVESRLRDHCTRQGWLLQSRLSGVGSVGGGVLGAAGAWHSGESSCGGGALPSASPWRASGGEMRSTGADRSPPDRLAAPQLHAALMLVRFPPSDGVAGIRGVSAVPRQAAGVVDGALQPALRSALLRHLMSPPQLPGLESVGPGAAAGFAPGCSAAACTLAGGCGYSAPAPDSGCAAAEADREERVACASVLEHVLMQRVRGMGGAAPLALLTAAAVLAAVGQLGVPDNAYARALVESQVGLILDGGG
jgi:hypothetical protein